MNGEGQALCHGAISILNAFATGKGGALGVDLWTRARVSLQDGHGELVGINTTNPEEPRVLMTHAVQHTLNHYGLNGMVSGEVVTWSNIPPGVGLKSSSAAANAIVLATMSALGKESDGDTVIKIATEASMQAGVSLTGAYDDAYACYFGGGVVTDNVRNKVEKKFRCSDGTRILVLVPSRKRYTGSLSTDAFKPIRGLVEIAYREASDSNLWNAMTLNGLAYSTILGEDTAPVATALENGALAAGLSGKGPAIAAITSDQKSANRVREALEKFPGEIMEVLPNIKEAVVEI